MLNNSGTIELPQGRNINILEGTESPFLPEEEVIMYKGIVGDIIHGTLPKGCSIVRSEGRSLVIRTTNGSQLNLNGGFYTPLKMITPGLALSSRGGILPPSEENFAELHPEAVTTLLVNEHGQYFDSRPDHVPTGGFTQEQAKLKLDKTMEALERNRSNVVIPPPLFIYEASPQIYGIAFLEAINSASYQRIHEFGSSITGLFLLHGPQQALEYISTLLTDMSNILRDVVHDPEGIDMYHAQCGLGNWAIHDNRDYSLTDWATARDMPIYDNARRAAIAIDLAQLIYSTETFTFSIIAPLIKGYKDEQKISLAMSIRKLIRSTVIYKYIRSADRSILEQLDLHENLGVDKIRGILNKYYQFPFH